MQKKKKFVLTPNEEFLMGVFWNSDQPLTSVELAELCKLQKWKLEHIINMIRFLEDKGMLEACGLVHYSRKYARSFRPTLSREEYAAKLALSAGIDEENLGNVIIAMIKNVYDTEDVSKHLEQVVRDIRKEIE